LNPTSRKANDIRFANANLIVERGHNGEVFEVKSQRYQLADMIDL
jgi:hypothetical protein